MAWPAANSVLHRQRGLTRDQVVWAYRILLDSEPESEHGIRVKMLAHRSVRDLPYEMLSSPEYRQKNALDPNMFVPLDPPKVRLPDRPPGPARFDRRVNKLCDLDDWHGARTGCRSSTGSRIPPTASKSSEKRGSGPAALRAGEGGVAARRRARLRRRRRG